MIRITVPGPATPERKRQVRQGAWTRRVDTPQARDYKGRVYARACEVMDGQLPLEGPLALTITIWRLKPRSWPKRRLWPDSRPDVDNYTKLVADALTGVVFRDDAQICRLVVEKRLGSLELLEVAVEPLGDPAPAAAAPLIDWAEEDA